MQLALAVTTEGFEGGRTLPGRVIGKSMFSADMEPCSPPSLAQQQQAGPLAVYKGICLLTHQVAWKLFFHA